MVGSPHRGSTPGARSRGMIGLVADDLTGASDAGVQFTRAGLSTRVLFEAHRPLPRVAVDALSIDTDTRPLPAGQAYTRVREVAEALRSLEPRHVYKKIDSTLRGNLGAEIDAIMDAFDASLAVVAPAFPALGRTTRDGVQYVRGTPVAQTEAAQDPRAPVHESNIVRLLEQQSRRGAAHIPLDAIARGPTAFRPLAEAQHAPILVCDAQTDEHLANLVSSFIDREDVVWVGSAGLAEQVAVRIEPGDGVARHPLSAPEGVILLICASLSEVTHRQAAAYAAQPDVVTVRVDPVALAGIRSKEAELRRCGCAVSAALREGRDCALVVGTEAVHSADAAQHIVDALGQLGADLMRQHRLGGVILTGGDTARAVCHAAGVTGIDLFGEIEPGVPLGRLIGEIQLPAVTKAGAFGSNDAVLHARRSLRELQPARKGASVR
ncbi:MAG: four-carbon acid sugar kinase family protein [Chloroflexi bacterium]|nr:four-carbon acid sugar kinase family protein [Chloroflexota bacterium]